MKKGMRTSLQVVVEMVENFSDSVLSPQGTQLASILDSSPRETFSARETYQHFAVGCFFLLVSMGLFSLELLGDSC